MMNIYEFLNSRDVRKHLESIKYEFSMLEKAFIIYKSNHKSLNDKKRAWKKLIDSTEDIILGEDGNKRWRYTDVNLKSAHYLINEYMHQLDEVMDLFFGSDEESFYTVELVYHPIDSIEVIRQDGGIYFKDFASAEAYCKDWLDSGEATVYEYIISKEYPIHYSAEKAARNRRKNIEAFYRNTGTEFEMVAIEDLGFEHHDDLDIRYEFFEKMWFDISIPFKRGDIVVGADGNWMSSREPFVLKGTIPWSYKERNLHKEGCDSSDMNAFGWSGGFYKDITNLNDDVMADYLDIEYYRGDFKGNKRLLKLMAEAEKGNVDYWDIITWYQRIAGGETDIGKECFGYTEEYKSKAREVLSEDPIYEN